ncbi:MAG: hypothetical protein NTX66_01570 [Candidatus Falkowbacteria bacterium]|nr:hypothetical protein [Candidatus Falkowbacteria bacterium]
MNKKIDKDLVAAFGKDYIKVKTELPELLEFARNLGKEAYIKDIDFQNKTAAFLGDRTEHGSSGGCGYWSTVTVWNNGESKQQEFQYRDRYSADKDRWEYCFHDLKIKSVKEKDDKKSVTILGNPGEKEIEISFEFEGTPSAKKKGEVLSVNEQLALKNFVNNVIDEILAEKSAKIKGNTRMAEDYSGHIPWKEPQLKEVVFDEENGVAVFSIIETIDYGSPVDIKTPQERCELYLAKVGEDIKEIDRDHGYVVLVEHPAYERIKDSKDYYGDPTMMGIKIMGDKV